MLMRDSTFGRSRRLLLAALLLWLVVGSAAYGSRRYLCNVLFGPFPIGRADLLTLADPNQRWEYFVTVDGDEVELLFPRAYTGGKEPYSLYGLMRVGEKWLLLRLPAGGKGRRLTGSLEGLSAFERDHVLGPRRQTPAGTRDFLPCRLEATRYFRTVGWLIGVLPLAALTALASGLTGRAIRGTAYRSRRSMLEKEVPPVTHLAGSEAAARLGGEQVLAGGMDAGEAPARGGRLLAQPASPAHGKPGKEESAGGHEQPAADAHGRLLVQDRPPHPGAAPLAAAKGE
jgi:hypothetical protein